MSAAPCVGCGAPSTLFCDFQIGMPIGGYERTGRVEDNRFWAYADVSTPMMTCDAPICEMCRKHIGQFHISGRPAARFSQTIDHCPMHEGAHEDPVPMTEDEAAAIRRAIIAKYQRRSFAVVERAALTTLAEPK